MRILSTLCTVAACAALALHGHTQIAFSSEVLVPGTSSTGDKFGGAIALDGDVLVVGARAYSQVLPTAGAATIFERQPDGSWGEVATLLPGTPEIAGHFGDQVAVSGDTVFVTELNDDTFGVGEGAVFIYRRQADGSWPLVQTLGPLDPDTEILFGSELAVDGERLAILAPGWFLGASGAVRVYLRQGDGSYALEDQITLPPGTYQGNFGSSIAMRDGWLVVGSENLWQVVEDPGGELTLLPVAFVFRRAGGGAWSLVAELTQPLDVNDQQFGRSVDIELIGDRALVAIGATDASPSGAADLFEVQADGAWMHLTRLGAPDIVPNSWFGFDVLLDGERLYVSDPLYREQGLPDNGRVYLYERSGPATWDLALELEDGVPPTAEDRLFGHTMVLDAPALLVGSPGAGGFSAALTGEVHVYSDTALFHSELSISVAGGGTHDLFLRAGPERAGEFHLLLGTVSGTSPGFPLPGGLVLPLVPDAYTDLTIAGGALVGGFGVLGPIGEADASLTLPAGGDPALVGLTAHHAFVTLDPTAQLTAVSGAAQVLLVP